MSLSALRIVALGAAHLGPVRKCAVSSFFSTPQVWAASRRASRAPPALFPQASDLSTSTKRWVTARHV
jgi:hypothetical protein